MNLWCGVARVAIKSHYYNYYFLQRSCQRNASRARLKRKIAASLAAKKEPWVWCIREGLDFLCLGIWALVVIHSKNLYSVFSIDLLRGAPPPRHSIFLLEYNVIFVADHTVWWDLLLQWRSSVVTSLLLVCYKYNNHCNASTHCVTFILWFLKIITSMLCDDDSFYSMIWFCRKSWTLTYSKVGLHISANVWYPGA